MTTPADVLTLAVADLGYVESPPNSNRTKYGRWYGADGAPWCAMAVSFWFYFAGLPLPASTAKGFAYTPSGAAWFQRNGRWSHRPSVGALAFFDFPGDGVNRISHVGIVESVKGDSIVTIEANTSPGSGGSQRDGGGVYRRVRKTGIAGYGVPAYTVPSMSPEDPVIDRLVILDHDTPDQPPEFRRPVFHIYDGSKQWVVTEGHANYLGLDLSKIETHDGNWSAWGLKTVGEIPPGWSERGAP